MSCSERARLSRSLLPAAAFPPPRSGRASLAAAEPECSAEMSVCGPGERRHSRRMTLKRHCGGPPAAP